MASLVSWYRKICLGPFKAKRRDEKKKLANDTPHNPDARSSPRLYIYQSSEWLIPLLNAFIIPPVHDVTIFCRSPVNSISPHIRLGIPLFSHELLPRCINRNGLQCEQWRDVRRLIVPVHGVISPTFDSPFPRTIADLKRGFCAR